MIFLWQKFQTSLVEIKNFYMQESSAGSQILIYASLMFQVYIIDVTDGQHRWTVKHRYSDFYDLHEKVIKWASEQHYATINSSVF